MKQLLLITLITILFFGCSSDEKKTETNADSTAANEISLDEGIGEVELAEEVSPESTFDLAYNIPNGEKLKYKLTSVATTNQKITADSTIENEVTQTVVYIFNLVSKGQKENNTLLDVTIESLNIEANYNGEKITYDSKVINDNETNLKFAEYSSLPNHTFELSINRQGRIQKINNIDAIVKSYLEVQNAQSITEEERTQLNNQLKDQALQPLVQQLFRYLPENETMIDSTWDLVYKSPMGLYTLTNTATSTLTDVVKKDGNLLAKITTDLSVSYQGDGFVQQGDVSYQFDKPKVSGNAVTYFNIDRRIIQRSELSTRTEINVLVTASNPDVGKETATRSDLSVNRNIVELISE